MTNAWPIQVFYDGACPLCSREMAHYRARDRAHHLACVDIAQPDFDARSYGLDPAKVQQAMHVRLPDGRLVTAVAAFVTIWEALPATLWTTFLRYLLKLPGMMWAAGIFYRWFARNRYRLTGRCTPESCSAPGAEKTAASPVAEGTRHAG